MSDGYGGQGDQANTGWNPPEGGYEPPGQAANYPRPDQPSQYPQPGPQPGQYPPPTQQPGQYPPPGQFPAPGQQPSGAGYPQQSYPPAAAMPEKKSRRGCLWALVLVPLLFVLGVGGCTAAVFFAVRGPIDATNNYVAHLDNGDYASAYELLCQIEQASFTLDEFATAQRSEFGDDITGYTFTSGEVQGVGSSQTATVSGTIQIDDSTTSRTFRLVEEDGNWKICR